MQRKQEQYGHVQGKARPFVSIGLLPGLVGVIIFGMTLPMTRIALEGFGPFSLGIGRAVPAGLLAGLVLWLSRQKIPPRKCWRSIALAAAGVVFGFPVLATTAMLYVPAAHGGVMLAMLPLATAMAGAIIAGERPSRGFWLAGVAGTFLVLAFAVIESGHFHPEPADLLLGGSIIAAAIGYIFSGMAAREIGGWQTIAWALVFSLPVSAGLAFAFAEPLDAMPSLTALAGFAYVAFMSQFIGFFFWNRGMALAGVSRTGQLQLLQPFVTLPASALLLGETVAWHHFGFALAVIGIVAIGQRMRVERGARP